MAKDGEYHGLDIAYALSCDKLPSKATETENYKSITQAISGIRGQKPQNLKKLTVVSVQPNSTAKVAKKTVQSAGNGTWIRKDPAKKAINPLFSGDQVRVHVPFGVSYSVFERSNRIFPYTAGMAIKFAHTMQLTTSSFVRIHDHVKG
ncbi:hypothetical protein L218DRAFT_943602 [Marasmius fiardii PR-910]|nr:hypothetical protein L218DRAFT_943602 [Marasmius fiardii PR-910]